MVNIWEQMQEQITNVNRSIMIHMYVTPHRLILHKTNWINMFPFPFASMLPIFMFNCIIWSLIMFHLQFLPNFTSYRMACTLCHIIIYVLLCPWVHIKTNTSIGFMCFLMFSYCAVWLFTNFSIFIVYPCVYVACVINWLSKAKCKLQSQIDECIQTIVFAGVCCFWS